MDRTPAGAGVFATTDWSAVRRAGEEASPEAEAALEQLCRLYWYPVYVYARRRGRNAHDAQDLTQDFFNRLVRRNSFAGLRREKGRFRSYLLAAFQYFLADQFDREQTLKRGGRQAHAALEDEATPIPATPAADAEDFDRAWALSQLTETLAQIRTENAERGEAIAVLEKFLPGACEPPSLEEAAARLGLPLGTLKTQVHRLRARFRELLRARVAATVETPHEIDEELAHLGRMLMSRGTELPEPPQRPA